MNRKDANKLLVAYGRLYVIEELPGVKEDNWLFTDISDIRHLLTEVILDEMEKGEENARY